MSFIIREGKIEDAPSILKLIQELANFENEADAVEVTVSDLEKDGFGDTPLFKIFVAEISEEIVGIALFYPRYSTWKGPTIHLEDLLVTEQKRGQKIGSALYKKVIEYGYNRGVKRIEWNVLDWNEPAVKFYESTGAKVLRDWDSVQIDRASMKKYLKV
ncbi:GNAT family N-acetyltransferase [Lutibacter sp. A80]|uniref:GNAT family N-acetyltransferase n=1 Tax=Lutibacter sp. A80 TaxID=2918453 RepID=UPI001F053D25|nr:GNAT family N-acetyltransferase [Lutibacter sp. A80]UMB59382.1 GNAT family N-acetyltransferase [Lutibacter sp. A80]